jgi:FkbM family methyltransferase
MRVHTLGRHRLYVNVERKFRPLGDTELNFSPMLAPGARYDDPFFLEHLDQFRGLYEAGAGIVVTKKGAVVIFGDVSFYGRNVEDFQVAREIFVDKRYAFRSSLSKVVVDIGMNVGLASLQLAADPTVIEVHSFEPFGQPFDRAVENFKLNPSLGRKIKPNRLGLGGVDESRDVLVYEGRTIGSSIRGHDNGVPEAIEVRDAARTLRPIFERAASLGAEIFLKVDCEGSEFAIFESLVKADLLTSVRGLLVEWHKWWSADKTREELIDPLIAHGFVIFDQTSAADYWAGQFNAVRVSS